MTCVLCRLNGKLGYGAGSAVASMNSSSQEHVFVNARTTAVGTGTFACPNLLASRIFAATPAGSLNSQRSTTVLRRDHDQLKKINPK